jgi:hypothetical protein
MTRLLRIGVAALAVPAAALVVSQAPAPAQTAPQPSVVLKLGARAHLSTDGKTAKVKVQITCKNAGPTPISVTVSQNRSTATASGTGESAATYKCNGRVQNGIVTVHPGTGEHFHTGGASASASVTLKDIGNGPASDTDSRNIQLTHSSS